MFKKLVQFGSDCGRKVNAFGLYVAALLLSVVASLEAGAQTTPTIYDPGVDISGLTSVAADGLGDVVSTALAVAFGFLVLAIGFAWVKRTMKSK